MNKAVSVRSCTSDDIPILRYEYLDDAGNRNQATETAETFYKDLTAAAAG